MSRQTNRLTSSTVVASASLRRTATHMVYGSIDTQGIVGTGRRILLSGTISASGVLNAVPGFGARVAMRVSLLTSTFRVRITGRTLVSGPFGTLRAALWPLRRK